MIQAGSNAAVLGKPITHSLSPTLHNAAYAALGLSQWTYGLHEVSEEGLEGFIRSLDSTWRGLSLTMPLKKRIIPLGHTRDKWSQLLGVANTAVFAKDEEKNGIDLYNTDVFGIEAALSDVGEPQVATLAAVEDPCLVIGSGSTAFSALAALCERGATRITFAARSLEKLTSHRQMAQQLGIETESISLDEVPDFLSRSALEVPQGRGLQYIISTVPAHAADEVAQQISTTGGDFSGTTVLDVVYDPSPTAFMSALKEHGATVMGGERMLLWQAVAQVSLMTGVQQSHIPVGKMREALKAELRRRGSKR